MNPVKASALRDPEVVEMVEAVLFPESPLPDEGTGALLLDAARFASKRDGEAPPRELAH